MRLRSWDRTLFTMIAQVADVQVPAKSRPSLANCPGYIALKGVRNAAVTTELCLEGDQQAAQALFGASSPASKSVKVQRKSAAEMADLRMHPQMVEATVQVADAPPFPVLFLKPGHVYEDVGVLLDSTVLDHVFRFIVEQGVSAEDLFAKRQYGTDHGPGVWSNGSAGLVRKIAPIQDDEGGDLAEDERVSAVKQQRFESMNKFQRKLTDMFHGGRAPATLTGGEG